MPDVQSSAAATLDPSTSRRGTDPNSDDSSSATAPSASTQRWLPPSSAVDSAGITDRPRAIGGFTRDGVGSLAGALLASLGLTWAVYEGMLPFSGAVGFVVCWWLVFLVFYGVVSWLSNPAPLVTDRVVTVVVYSAALLVAAVLMWMLWHVVSKGYHALLHLNFYTDDMAGVRPTDPLSKGGILHAIVGTLIQVGIAVGISLPLGVGTAVYMTEVGGRLARVVRTVVEAMSALPDILAGLFVYTFLIIGFGMDRTGFTAAISLVVTAVPIIARSSEVALRVVAGNLREASLALGASQWQTVWRVVLPTARSGLMTSLILGVARIAGETAPLLIVSGASTFLNFDPFSEQMNSLPLFIYSSVRSGEPLYIERGYGAATLLLVLVMVLFVLARFVVRDRRRR